MTEKSIMLDLQDPRAGKIAEIIGNKTCKKILEAIAEKEMSESEIVSALGIPGNTVNYNIKKLRESGLIEETKGFLWSSKGKRILRYRVSNKKIVISPRSVIRGIVPSAIASFIIAMGLKIFVSSGQIAQRAGDYAGEVTSSGGMTSGAERATGIIAESSDFSNMILNAPNSWAWFLIGALSALLIFILWNWKK